MACGCGKKTAQQRAETPRAARRSSAATPRATRREAVDNTVPAGTRRGVDPASSKRRVLYTVIPRGGGEAVTFDRLETARAHAREVVGKVEISRR
jgi:hypothetical protein